MIEEFRLLYWNQREVKGAMQQSRTHLYPLDRQIALCGRGLPDLHAYDVMGDDAGNEQHRCKSCESIAEKRGNLWLPRI